MPRSRFKPVISPSDEILLNDNRIRLGRCQITIPDAKGAWRTIEQMVRNDNQSPVRLRAGVYYGAFEYNKCYLMVPDMVTLQSLLRISDEHMHT